MLTEGLLLALYLNHAQVSNNAKKFVVQGVITQLVTSMDNFTLMKYGCIKVGPTLYFSVH